MLPLFSKKRAAHLRLGKRGEEIAERMYLLQGCDILARDCRMPKGEIDLILRDGFCLVFAEVKTRNFKTPGSLRAIQSRDVLHYRQKRRIYRAAFSYMKKIGSPAIAYRFDLVQVLFLDHTLYEIRHMKNAFGQRTFSKRSENLFV